MIHLLIKIKEFDAHGGPAQKMKGTGDRFAATPTTEGRYIIQTIEKHISRDRYNYYSGIPWGAGLKFVNDVTYVDVRNNGLWVKLTSIIPQWIQRDKTEKLVKDEILQYWRDLTIATKGGSSVNLYNEKIPDKWLFSDFGHVSVKYFVDRNHDGIMNKKETIMSDFIHTTPSNEAVSYYNTHVQANQLRFRLNLPESHGCIHVKPTDIDTMIGAGYLKKGEVIVVHSYNDKVIPATLKPNQFTRSGYEAHFFPGLFKIATYKVT